jgi:hypothetical protein
MEDGGADGGDLLPAGGRCRLAVGHEGGPLPDLDRRRPDIDHRYDYLRTGLRHMAEDTPPGAAE